MRKDVTLYSFRKSRPVLSNGNKTFIYKHRSCSLWKDQQQNMCLEFDVWRDHLPVAWPFLRIFFAFIFVTRASRLDVGWRNCERIAAANRENPPSLVLVPRASQRVDAGKCQVARHFCISLVVMLSCVHDVTSVVCRTNTLKWVSLILMLISLHQFSLCAEQLERAAPERGSNCAFLNGTKELTLRKVIVCTCGACQISRRRPRAMSLS
jgi:hypothetical protein